MIISIQPLDQFGKPTDKTFTTDWAEFLADNDGFSIAEVSNMQSILTMGSGYLLGGGAMGAFRLKKIGE